MLRLLCVGLLISLPAMASRIVQSTPVIMQLTSGTQVHGFSTHLQLSLVNLADVPQTVTVSVVDFATTYTIYPDNSNPAPVQRLVGGGSNIPTSKNWLKISPDPLSGLNLDLTSINAGGVVSGYGTNFSLFRVIPPKSNCTFRFAQSCYPRASQLFCQPSDDAFTTGSTHEIVNRAGVIGTNLRFKITVDEDRGAVLANYYVAIGIPNDAARSEKSVEFNGGRPF